MSVGTQLGHCVLGLFLLSCLPYAVRAGASDRERNRFHRYAQSENVCISTDFISSGLSV